jgi:hypothetical protein
MTNFSTPNLTVIQKNIFEVIWNRYVDSGKPFPFRSFPEIIGKLTPQEALVGLNGDLIYELQEQGNSCFKLTLYGAFQTENGSALEALLIKLLNLVKELYEQDTLIEVIDRDHIQTRLSLSDIDTHLLFRMLTLGLPPGLPVYLSGWVEDGRLWKIVITDAVVGLYRVDDTATYLNEHLMAGYRPDKPCFYNERFAFENRGAPIFNSTNALTGAFGQISEPYLPSYISPARLNELKNIQNTSFDCTRLISMCEELNECASRENAHAVIMLTRAILDHIPPAFQFEKFSDVAAQYKGGGKSFRESIERLEKQARKVADRLLHMPIRAREVAPTMHEVSFVSETETLLAEFCRIMK